MSRAEHIFIVSLLTVGMLCNVVIVTAIGQIVWENWGICK